VTTVSVIIPTLNASLYLENLLKALNSQVRKPEEIMIIDSSSDDNTIEIAQAFSIKTISIPRKSFNHGGTRNLALRHTRGDYVIFLTQDAVPENQKFISHLIKPLKSPDIAASFGRQYPQADAKPPERFARLFNYPSEPLVKGLNDKKYLGIKTFFFTNVCSCLKRKELENAGGFPEKTILNEDMIAAARLINKGYKIAYAPEAVVIHSHNYSLVQQFKRYFDIGVSLKENEWILRDVKPEGEGMKFFKEEIKYLLSIRAYKYLPYILGETGAKFIGFKCGFFHNILPSKVKKKLSMHSFFWD
jgi:rhamnosyltransferase